MMTVRSCEYHVFELFVFEHTFGKQPSLLSLSIHGLLTSDTWFCCSRRLSNSERSNNFAQPMCVVSLRSRQRHQKQRLSFCQYLNYKFSSDNQV